MLLDMVVVHSLSLLSSVLLCDCSTRYLFILVLLTTWKVPTMWLLQIMLLWTFECVSWCTYASVLCIYAKLCVGLYVITTVLSIVIILYIVIIMPCIWLKLCCIVLLQAYVKMVILLNESFHLEIYYYGCMDIKMLFIIVKKPPQNIRWFY